MALNSVAVDSAELSWAETELRRGTRERHTAAVRRSVWGKANITLGLGNVTLNVTFSWSAGCGSHTGPMAVKVDAPRRRLGR